MNQKEEKWEPEFDQTFAKDFFSANCTCGAFHATKLKKFIKERFLYKPDLIALVEGGIRRNFWNGAKGHGVRTHFDKADPKRGNRIAVLDDILATLKDTLSNKE